MDLSILIINWNTRDLLLKCLESVDRSIADLPGLRSEILVVDNASVDGSADAVRGRFPLIRLISNQSNEGFAEANNRAWSVSSGEFVLLLNPDTELVELALRKMLDFLRNRPAAAAVGPALIDVNGAIQNSCYPIPTLWREFWRMFHLDALYPLAKYPLLQWSEGKARQVDVLQGACILLRKTCLEEDQMLFPFPYFMYTEDVDLCFRLKSGGWATYWIPSAKVIHHGGQSTRQVRIEMFIELYRSKLEFFRRHRGNFSAFLYKILLVMVALTRIAAAPILALSSRKASNGSISHRYLVLMKSLPNL